MVGIYLLVLLFASVFAQSHYDDNFLPGHEQFELIRDINNLLVQDNTATVKNHEKNQVNRELSKNKVSESDSNFDTRGLFKQFISGLFIIKLSHLYPINAHMSLNIGTV